MVDLCIIMNIYTGQINYYLVLGVCMKKIFLIVLAALAFLSGCVINEPNDIDKCNSFFPKEFNNIVSNRPLYLTSLGQSIDIENLIVRLEHYKITDYYRENILNLDLIRDNSVIFLVAGCSMKGLGDAGTNVNNEIERAYELMAKKESKNLTIIVFHIGGNERRGATSDRLIEEAFKISDLVIFLEAGNEDGYLCEIVNKYNLHHVIYSNIGQMDSALISLFDIN